MEREYEVVGDNRVHGHDPGETFTADLADHEEALLVASGNVRRVKRAKVEGAVETAKVETATLPE